MRCEVCGCTFRRIETSLVCQNGHTLQNMTEVAHDEDAPCAKTRRIKKRRKIKQFFKSSGCSLMKMILLKLLYEEAKIFFEITDDRLFKYFTGFFEFREGKLVSSIDVSKEILFVLIYASKRSELESKGEMLFFTDFILKFKNFRISNRLSLIKNRFSQLEPPCSEFKYADVTVTIRSLKKMIDILSDPYNISRTFKIPIKNGNGVFQECIDVCKFNFRSLFRNDLELMNHYFNQLCKVLEVEITEELTFYFKKFIYSFNNHQVILPEFDMPMFIAMFMIWKENFENTVIEFNILNYLGVDKPSFRHLVWNQVTEIRHCVSPEEYIRHLKYKNIKRFKRLRNSIEFIEAFKLNKAKSILNSSEKEKFKCIFSDLCSKSTKNRKKH